MNHTPHKFTLNAFEESLQQALKLLANPAQLGTESPLAASYFLWPALRHQPNISNAVLRGETLRNEILQAAASLWGKDTPQSARALQAALDQEADQQGTPCYAYLLLELHYFQTHLRPRNPAAIYDDLLHLSKASYYRALNTAIQQLGRALLTRLQPTLRRQQPVLPSYLVGYTAPFEQCQTALTAGQNVSIIGPGGVGKSTLAAAVTSALSSHPLFWFTFRTTLNDHLDSLLMALGYFLAEQGATHTWQFLLASGGKIANYHLVTALVQQDLELLRPKAPILCFDEFDRLHNSDPDHANPAHTQLLAFIESIYHSAAVLLVGQRALLASHVTIQLTGLPVPQVQSLLANVGLRLPPDEITQLTNYTQGNPRLLLLFVALYQQDEPVAMTLDSLPQSPELGLILGRLWNRLETNERQLLQQLAVFRSYAPIPSGTQDDAVLQTLIDLHLLQQNGRGGIQILPVLGDWVYHEMSQTQREQHHLSAALIRHQVAEYTAAAYHFKRANYPAQAIQAWYPQQDWEIQQGQGDAARAIFLHLSPRGLSAAEQDALREICGRLHALRDENELGLIVVRQEKQSAETAVTSSEVKVRLKILNARFLQALGNPFAAIESYEDAINMSAHLQQQIDTARFHRSRLYINQREFSQAWREAHLMEYQLYMLHGQLYAQLGQYEESLSAYARALNLAEKLQDEQKIAEVHYQLGAIYTLKHQTAEAVHHTQTALAFYKQIRHPGQVADCETNLAAAYMNADSHAAAIEPLRKSLVYYQQAKDIYSIAQLTANLAECYFEIGDSTQAERYAYQSIEQEEPQAYPYAYHMLGRVRRRANQQQQAKDYFNEAIRIAQRNQDPYIESYLWQELGGTHLELGDHVAAHKALCKALHLFKQLGVAHKAEEAHRLLGQCQCIKDASDVSI